MNAKFNPSTIHPQKRISMQRAFSGSIHKNVPAVALHVWVKTELAQAYLKHLIATKQIPNSNSFAKYLITKKK